MDNQKLHRESFIFYRSFYEAIEEADEKAQLELYRAIAKYSLDGTPPTGLKGMVKALWNAFKPQLDANTRRFLNGLKGAEHGKKGGAKTGNQNARKTTPKQPLNDPKTTPNVNVNVNVNDNVNKNIPPIIPQEEFLAPDKTAVIEEAEKIGMGMEYGVKFFDYYALNDWRDKKGRKLKDWKAVLRAWSKSEPPTGVKLGVGEFIDPTGRRTYGTGKATIPMTAEPRPTEKHCWNEAQQNWIIL